jgi:hypothetical protein
MQQRTVQMVSPQPVQQRVQYVQQPAPQVIVAKSFTLVAKLAQVTGRDDVSLNNWQIQYVQQPVQQTVQYVQQPVQQQVCGALKVEGRVASLSSLDRRHLWRSAYPGSICV